MKPGSDISDCAASSPTRRLPACNATSTLLRVGSASAAKVASSATSLAEFALAPASALARSRYLTMRFSIVGRGKDVKCHGGPHQVGVAFGERRRAGSAADG